MLVTPSRSPQLPQVVDQPQDTLLVAYNSLVAGAPRQSTYCEYGHWVKAKDPASCLAISCQSFRSTDLDILEPKAYNPYN